MPSFPMVQCQWAALVHALVSHTLCWCVQLKNLHWSSGQLSDAAWVDSVCWRVTPGHIHVPLHQHRSTPWGAGGGCGEGPRHGRPPAGGHHERARQLQPAVRTVMHNEVSITLVSAGPHTSGCWLHSLCSTMTLLHAPSNKRHVAERGGYAQSEVLSTDTMTFPVHWAGTTVPAHQRHGLDADVPADKLPSGPAIHTSHRNALRLAAGSRSQMAPRGSWRCTCAPWTRSTPPPPAPCT